MNTPHPQLESLVEYIQSPDATEFKELKMHLITCIECRARVDQLSRLEEDITRWIPRIVELNHTSSSLDPQELDRYIKQQMSPAEQASTAQILHSDKQALRSALHYACHSHAMSQARHGTEPASDSVKNKTEIQQPTWSIARVLAPAHEAFTKLFSWRAPAWSSIAATAAVVLVLSNNLSNSSPDYVIAAYQDQTDVQFISSANKRPGIGFFEPSIRSSAAFSGVRIELNSKKHFKFNWSPIDGAKNYVFELVYFDHGNKISAGSAKVENTQVILSDHTAILNKRYHWRLHGETTSGENFETHGGFVYSSAASTMDH